MHPAVELIRFVLGPLCRSEQEALVLLQQALLREVEPLHYLATFFTLSENHIYERAATWSGLRFSAALPSQLPAGLDIERVDNLFGIKSVRAELDGRDVLFLSPGLTQFLQIRERVQSQFGLAQRISVVPPAALRAGIMDRAASRLLEDTRSRLSRLWPRASAHLELRLGVRLAFVIALVALALVAAFTPIFLQPVLVPVMAFLLLVPAGLRLAAAIHSVRTGEQIRPPAVPDDELPDYTILIALRDEANMIPQLAAALRRLDYPPEKLDIKFVVESASRSTLEEVARLLDDARFELVIVPEAAPVTKPKALNYALPMARGQYLVIYDAEDIPEPVQLRRAAELFASQPGLDCIQAELVVDNAGENVLTALFAGEYAGQFGLMFPALARWDMPLPLGGTSNHFRLQSLREVGGWDSFNVTEDADLGVRLKRLRYRCGAFSSRTYEEAPIRFGPWMRQRTRWMKGWMQTFIVHNSRPLDFLRDIGWRNFLIFQAYVGGMLFSAPLHSVFAVVFFGRLVLGFDPGFSLTEPWSLAQLTILVTGYGTAFIVAVMGLWRLGQRSVLKWQLLLPFYWLLTSWASMRALYQLIEKPYVWEKTPHGLTRYVRGSDK